MIDSTRTRLFIDIKVWKMIVKVRRNVGAQVATQQCGMRREDSGYL